MKKYTSHEILDILKNNKDLLLKYHVKKIGLFGSSSHNIASNESDIDFIVDFNKKTFDNFMDLSFALEELFDRKIDLVTDKSISPYLLQIIRDEVKWYEAN